MTVYDISGLEAMKKPSASNRGPDSAAKKKGPWKGHDFDSMPELTEEQIASPRRVSKSEHKKLSLAVRRHVGRPRKPEAENEELVSIRFSANFLQRLKEKARQEGYTAWQTYEKKVLAEHVKKLLDIPSNSCFASGDASRHGQLARRATAY